MHVEVAVVEIDVPTEGEAHLRKGHGVGDELDEALVQADEPQLVEGLTRARAAAVDDVDRREEARDLRLRERIWEDGEPQLVEIGLHRALPYEAASA